MKSLRALPVVAVFLVLSTCSGMNGMGQLLIDAGQMMADAGNGNAQTAPRSLTADTDASRLEGGIVPTTSSTPLTLVTGPIVLTTLTRSEGTSMSAWIVAEATDCSVGSVIAFAIPNSAPVGGLLVRQGQKVCVLSGGSNSSLLWAGYRPY